MRGTRGMAAAVTVGLAAALAAGAPHGGDRAEELLASLDAPPDLLERRRGHGTAESGSFAFAVRTPAPADRAPRGVPLGPSRPGPSTDRSGAPSGSRAALQEDAGGPPYDGRFTFLRIRFGGASRLGDGLFGRGRGGGREPIWAHDMPRAERNFAKILAETTAMAPYMEGGRVLDFDDPELFKYPIAYIVEVGAWRPSEAEVLNLREYLLKGGFLIVDDFRGSDIYAFVQAMRRVLPDHEVVELPPDHEIFDSFFHIEDPTSVLPPPTFRQYVPVYLGIFEDDDPSKRLLAVINYNNDIAEYWEYSDWGYYPIDLSNEAYKFGVNYVVYAMTH